MTAGTTQFHKNNSLWNALKNGSLERLKSSLLAGADPNAVDSLGSLPLDLVRINKNDRRVEQTRLLIEAGADPNFKPGKRISDCPFMRACHFGHYELAFSMLDPMAKVPVDFLRRARHGQLYSIGLSSNCPIDFLDVIQRHFEQTALPFNSHLHRGHLWLSPDHKGRNAFMSCMQPKRMRWIASQNFLPLDELLELTDREDHETPLWHAALSEHKGSVAVVELLIGMGAKLDPKNRNGLTLRKCLDRQSDDSARIKAVKSMLKSALAAQEASRSIDSIIQIRTKIAP